VPNQGKKQCQPVLMSIADPALPIRDLEREFKDTHGNKVVFTLSPSNHFVLIDDQPVLYSENFAAKLWRLAKIPQEAMDECVNVLKDLATELQSGKSLKISQINGMPAAKCKLAEVFLQNGFEMKEDELVFQKES